MGFSFKDLKISKWISKNGFGKKAVDAFDDVLSGSGLDRAAGRTNILKNARDLIDKSDIDDEAKKRLSGLLTSAPTEKEFLNRSNAIFNHLGTVSGDSTQAVKSEAAALQKSLEHYNSGNYSGMFGEKGIGLTDKIKGYMFDPVNGMGKTRMITTAGAYAGVNVGGRLVSGGSITRNSDGERDIAGIPFI